MHSHRPLLRFAHRGAPRHRSERNTLPAFQRALSLGAPGIETDIGLTPNGVPIIQHVGLPLPLRCRSVAPNPPTLAEMYEQCGTEFALALDMGAPQAIEAVVRVAERFHAVDQLWVTYWRLPELELWRRRWPRLHLVYATFPGVTNRAPSLFRRLSTLGVDTVNVYHPLCTPALVGVAHDQGLSIFAWGIRRAGSLRRAIDHGVDGVFCDNSEHLINLVT